MSALEPPWHQPGWDQLDGEESLRWGVANISPRKIINILECEAVETTEKCLNIVVEGTVWCDGEAARLQTDETTFVER